ncbi:MAG: amidohydrolase family protein [Desulfobulbaceae bacterium]|nr:amidohydrolase family protein [Desulfobulbaceae bacterium]
MGHIDFHTHAFPDALALRAISSLEVSGNIRAYGEGTIQSLLASMDAAGIEQSVLCSIATRPGQFADILQWSLAIRSDRIIPLPSVHPQDEQLLEHVQLVHAQGFAGIKMHSYYQNYFLDDPALFPLYDILGELGMLLVIHAGYDIAFPRERRADPARIDWITRRWPKLKLIATHVGGWEEWDEVERLLIGRPVYLELSFGADFMPAERLKRLLLAHPQEYLLFGSDSPWTDQKKSLEALRNLDLPQNLFERITSGNARRLLRSLGRHCQS